MPSPIKIKVKVDVSKIKAAFARLNGDEKKKILDKVVRNDAQGFVRDVVAITPPGSQKGLLKVGGGGMKAGKIAVYRDLKQVFEPLDDSLVDHAVESGMWGNTQRLFVKKDGTVYGCEQSLFRPDTNDGELYDHHRRYFKGGRMTKVRTFGMDQANSIGKWKFITKLVIRRSAFNSYLKYVYEKIGSLAGGWAKAAKKLNVRLPKEVTRHASGDAEFIPGAHSFIIKLLQPVSYATEADINRRVAWVLDSKKRAARMEKRIKFEIEAAAKRLGISL